MEQETNTLLLIDCQNDFHPGGSLAIPSALDDAERISKLIRDHASNIHRIVATLDSHQKLHIAHPSFWWSADGSMHPDPFTIISAQDIRLGTWKPRNDIHLKNNMETSSMIDSNYFANANAIQDESGNFDITKYALEYAIELEARGRFQICIWPEHCLIGSPGHAVVDCIRQALSEWSELTGRSVEWVFKGEHMFTEMYSALEADVPVSMATAFNDVLHSSLMKSSRLFVCGQAMSHCVNYTLRDIVAKWNENELDRICLLTDCASAVPGFELAAKTFMDDMKEKGIQLKTAAEFAKLMRVKHEN
jgi:nicotinamidase/pyrazinamidase